MSLCSKPPEMVDELRISLLLMRAARRVVGLAVSFLQEEREGRLLQPPPQLKLSLRSNPLEYVAQNES
jgi:hypothetical protein